MTKRTRARHRHRAKDHVGSGSFPAPSSRSNLARIVPLSCQTNPREAKPGDTRALDARLEPADAQPPARQRIVKDPVLRSAARKVAGGGGSWRRRPVAFTGIAPARTRRAWPR